MKTFLFSVFLCAPLWLTAQAVDSAVIRQVDSLLQVAKSLSGSKDFEKALESIASAEKLALSVEAGMGPESAAYGACCFSRALIFRARRDYAQAEKWHLEAISVRQKALGKIHPAYAESLNELAALYTQTGKFDKAEPLFLEAMEIREKVLGKEHPEYANTLSGLGILYFRTGKVEKAESLFLEAKDIREKAYGKEHSVYASSLNSLAVVYKNMNQFEKAEAYYLEALSVFEKTLGKSHSEYGQSLNNLAVLYKALGQYEKAEPLLLEAKGIREKSLGKKHPDYAQSLINLANLYLEMSQFEKSEACYLEANRIFEEAFGKEHPSYALGSGNLALLYKAMGAYEKAEPLLLETKKNQEKVMGKANPGYAGDLINLATMYDLIGQKEKAETYLLEAKNIFELDLRNSDHTFYMNCLENLGLLYFHTGQYEKAAPLLLEVKSIREKIVGKENPDFGITLDNLTKLYWVNADCEQAVSCLSERANLNRRFLARATNHLSERELSSYLKKFSFAQNLAMSFASKSEGAKLIPVCYDNILFHKGFLFNAASRLNRLAESSPAGRELLLQLKGYQRRLAAQYALPVTDRGNMAELEEKANTAEKELSRTVAGYAEAARQVRWADVQAALKPGEAAVEFIRFHFVNPNSTDSVLYVALVLRPGPEASGAPQYISLFEEKTLSALLQQGGEKQTDHVNSLYRNPALYTLLWQPLEQALAGAKTVYFSPDGLLHRLNLRAIATPDGSILADRYRLIRMNSTRQLVIPASTKVVANDALVYGGIQYDMDATAMQKANASLSPTGLSGSRGDLDFQQTDSTLRAGYRGPGENGAGGWQYLPFTEVEAELLQHDLQEAGASVRVLSGYAATEESFKSIGHPSPRILHLATHGFFFPDPNPQSAIRNPQSAEPVFKISEHPMIRSGLLLAGANQAWKTGKPVAGGLEDGILTAYEISQMDLSNTELAVLSACETGLGDIAGNEGVYGLQRAFKIAGTRYLLMSLWQVSDLETQQFMTVFYRHWLKDGLLVPDAYRATQQEMRERFKDPFLWAGFVLVE